jgi:hypothetical protein
MKFEIDAISVEIAHGRSCRGRATEASLAATPSPHGDGGVDAAPPRRSCHRVTLRSSASAVLAALASGCFTMNGVSSGAIPAVRSQASTDLDCPQNQIRVTKDLTGHFQAIGCGHKVEYNASCDAVGSPTMGQVDAYRCVAAPEGQVVPWAARPDPTPTPN